ncbi:hypothetical protein ABPG74_006960 [Tetrahymena malaccensis]
MSQQNQIDGNQKLQEEQKDLSLKSSFKQLTVSYKDLRFKLSEELKNVIKNPLVLNQVFNEFEKKYLSFSQKIESLHEQNKDDSNESHLYQPQIQMDQYGYDMIICMESVFDLQNEQLNETPTGEYEVKAQMDQEIQQNNSKKKKGLKVLAFNDNHLKYCKNQTIVGFQGQRNNGKTFILNILTNSFYPSGAHVSTPGVCLKFYNYDNKNIIYIDSEGRSCPIEIDYDNNKNYQKLKDCIESEQKLDDELEKKLQDDITSRHLDQKVTEQLQQEFIINSSHILLIVVSNLTQDEQKMIHTISQLISAEKKETKVFIIHNLKEFHRVEYVQDYINKLKVLYPLRELPILTYESNNQNKTVFIDCINSGFSHLIMANNNSPAGNYYNQFAISYLKSVISMCQSAINFSVIDKLQEYFNKNLQNFLILKNSNGEEIQDKEKGLLKYDKENQVIILKEQYKIEKVKELSVNVFGLLQKECSYTIYDSDVGRVLIVEIPGKVQTKKKFNRKKGIFNIRIIPDNQSEQQHGQIYASTRKFEEKYQAIRICKEEELWTFDKTKSKDLQNGLYQFVFTREEDIQSD